MLKIVAELEQGIGCSLYMETASGATTFFEVEGARNEIRPKAENFFCCPSHWEGQISVFAPPIGGCKILQI